jgi:hypothetical protein
VTLHVRAGCNFEYPTFLHGYSALRDTVRDIVARRARDKQKKPARSRLVAIVGALSASRPECGRRQ